MLGMKTLNCSFEMERGETVKKCTYLYHWLDKKWQENIQRTFLKLSALKCKADNGYIFWRSRVLNENHWGETVSKRIVKSPMYSYHLLIINIYKSQKCVFSKFSKINCSIVNRSKRHVTVKWISILYLELSDQRCRRRNVLKESNAQTHCLAIDASILVNIVSCAKL